MKNIRVVTEKIKTPRGFNYVMECLVCQKNFRIYGAKYNAGFGKYCSWDCSYKSQVGKFVSQETRNKMSVNLKGKVKSPKAYKFPKGKENHNYGKDMSGENNPGWKGDNVGYNHIHNWIRKVKAKPKKCEHCGVSGRKIAWANKSHRYLRDLDDWLALCYSCHYRYDRKS